jgi:hypothetical protein
LQTSPSLERNSFVGVSEAFEQCWVYLAQNTKWLQWVGTLL